MNLKAFEYIANDENFEKTVVHIPRSHYTFIIVNTKSFHYQTHLICKEIYENFTQTILPNNDINLFKSKNLINVIVSKMQIKFIVQTKNDLFIYFHLGLIKM